MTLPGLAQPDTSQATESSQSCHVLAPACCGLGGPLRPQQHLRSGHPWKNSEHPETDTPAWLRHPESYTFRSSERVKEEQG